MTKTMMTRAVAAGLLSLPVLVAFPTAGYADDPRDPGEELPVAECSAPRTLISRYVPTRRATVRLRYSAGCHKYWANATLDSYSASAPAGCDGVEIRVKVQSGLPDPRRGIVVQAERTKSDTSAGCSGSQTIVVATAGVDRFTSQVIGRACVGLYEGVPITDWACTSWHNA